MSANSNVTYSKSRSRLTLDLRNFSYGGSTPLYSTFESELNFDSEHIQGTSSDDDMIHYPDDSDSHDSDQALIGNVTSPSHVPMITPFHPNTEENTVTQSQSPSHTNHSKSIAITQSSMIPKKNETNHRKRAQTNKFTHISRKSFNHFRIKSITIHSHKSESIVHSECDYKTDTESDTIDSPGHRSTGTTLINGHPPLPSLPDTDLSHKSENNSKSEIINLPKTVSKKKRKTVGFATNVVDPKRKYIEKEIIETEETYYRGLNTLLNELLLPMFENNLISQKYFEQCTSNLPDLLAFHDTFLSDLVSVYECDKSVKFESISQVFNAQNKQELIDLYLKYIRDYDSIMDLFGNTFHKNAKLQTFLKQKRRERKPLTNFLILPVQRVPRYILLLSDLKKHSLSGDSDYGNIENALELMHQIANEINDRKREIEQMSQCLQIQSALTNLKESIVKPGREYQKQFVFVKKAHSHQRQLFVFTDLIIVTNHSWRVKHILDIRTVDIKLLFTKANSLKKSKKSKLKSIAMLHKSASANNMSASARNGNKTFVEFVLLYLSDKPCVYIAKDMSEFEEFESLVTQNRLALIDSELAKESDTSQIREALALNGVSQAKDYQSEVASLKTQRKRGNASLDKYSDQFMLRQSKSTPVCQ